LESYYDRAKLTIEVLNENMVKPEVPNETFFKFYSDVTEVNVIKLLMIGT